MVEISNCKEPCFAKLEIGCLITTAWAECKCPFYKPKGCEDWVRRETDGRVWLIPPEEYFKEDDYGLDKSEDYAY